MYKKQSVNSFKQAQARSNDTQDAIRYFRERKDYYVKARALPAKEATLKAKEDTALFIRDYLKGGGKS